MRIFSWGWLTVLSFAVAWLGVFNGWSGWICWLAAVLGVACAFLAARKLA